MITVQNIEHEIVDDNDWADLSWLDQTDDEMGEGFEARAEERKHEYGRSWHMVGVRLVAKLFVPDGGPGSNFGFTRRVETPGLWGLESDSEPSYFAAVALDELPTLTGMLNQIHVEPNSLDEAVSYFRRQHAA